MAAFLKEGRQAQAKENWRLIRDGDVGEILTFEYKNLCRLKPENEPPSLTAAAEAKAVKKLRRVMPGVALASYAAAGKMEEHKDGRRNPAERCGRID